MERIDRAGSERMLGDERESEDAELASLREWLIGDARDAAYVEARRIRREARAFQIARARMDRGRSSSRAHEMELRSIALELGAPLRILDRTMQSRLADSAALVERFSATVDALEAGRISRRHVDAVLQAGTPIDDPAEREAFERVVIRFAENDTPARTRSYARRLAEQLHPRTLEERFAEASDMRLVTVAELEDGMAEIRALLPAAVAFGIHDRLTRMATQLKSHDERIRAEHRTARAAALKDADADAARRGLDASTREDAHAAAVAALPFPPLDGRTRDQMRADLFGDLLLTGCPAIDPTATTGTGLGAIRGHVQITVPATTLTGVTSGGGELNGRCAVDDVTARRLAGDAPGWDRVFTHAVTGTVLEVDRYEPLASQRRFLRARDQHCRAPGCRRPARESQLDHGHEWRDGGRTRLDNLASLCVRHHTVKTESEWTVQQSSDGSLVWSSPLGFTYRDDPPKRVVFVPDAEPPPF